MKKSTFAAAVLLASVVGAHAQTTGIGIGQSASQSGAVAGAQSSNALIFNSPSVVTTRTRGRIVQTVPGIGPALTASAVQTCLGSWSLGVGVTGLGLSGGSTYLEKHCEARMTGTLLSQMGAKQAGLLALCHNPIAYDALAASGIRCPFGEGRTYSATTQVAPVVQPVALTPAQQRALARQQAQAQPASYVGQGVVVAGAGGPSKADAEHAAALAARDTLYRQCVAGGGSNCGSFR